MNADHQPKMRSVWPSSVGL